MAFLTKKYLPRRSFIRGVGVTLALPFLESMVPAASAFGRVDGRPRTRLGCICFPHGALMDKWTPASDGTGFEFPQILKPLEPFRDQVNVVSHLRHALAYGVGATSNHNRSAAAFLSGADAKVGAQPSLGITIDQIVAQKHGQNTPLPSLELMIDQTTVNCGDGLSCVYRDTISWQGPTAPLPMQNNPQIVFERLFGDGSTSDQRKVRRQQSKSLLDSVLDETSALQLRVPPSDRSRLDQFLTDVREVERRIQTADKQLSDDLPIPVTPTGIPTDVEEHIKLMYDLQVLAWQADITRVSTFLMAKELVNTVYPKSGVRDAFHLLSHHSNIVANMNRFAVLNMYHVALFAYFLEKLKATPDGEGTLLDHALVLYGSGMGDGNLHNHTNLPILVVGGASGHLKGGRHLRQANNTPMANLLLAMLHIMDVPIETFGDSTEAIAL